MIPVRITKHDPRAEIPEYKTPGAAAFDLAILDDITIAPRSSQFLHTGLIFGLPVDHVMLVFARSSLFKKFGLMLTNNVGVLDADYCGPEDECLLSVWNPQDVAVDIKAGTRIAQAMVLPRPRVEFVESEASAASRGGWGSTG